MAELRLAAAEIELGLDARHEDRVEDAPIPEPSEEPAPLTPERIETLEAAIGQPIVDAPDAPELDDGD
jgi:hypothetical protein